MSLLLRWLVPCHDRGYDAQECELRIAQYAAAADPGRALAMARQFVLGKIKNCRTLLRRNLLASDRKAEQAGDCPDFRSTKMGLSPSATCPTIAQEPQAFAADSPNSSSPSPAETPSSTETPETVLSPLPAARVGSSDGREVLKELALLFRRAEEARDAASLLGIEGMAAKAYFAGFARILKGGEEFNIEGRNRRPPRDPVNALLSFVYAILAKELTLALQRRV